MQISPRRDRLTGVGEEGGDGGAGSREVGELLGQAEGEQRREHGACRRTQPAIGVPLPAEAQ